MKSSCKWLRKPYVCASCRRSIVTSKRRTLATTSPKTPDIYDVVAVGGGPVGLALLAALKASPLTSSLKIALLETQDLSKAQQWASPDDQYSNRASSLTPSSIDFLESIDAWKHVDQRRVQPYGEMQVWDGANDSRIQFDWKAEAERYNAPRRSVATMTENSNLTRGLLTRILELSQNEPTPLFSSTTVASIENGEDDLNGLNLSSWPVLSLSSTNLVQDVPPRIAARLLVGADGVNSPVRQYAGIASKGWDYDRHGVVATLKLAPTEDSSDSFFSAADSPSHGSATAYQRFLPALGGPVALLPLPDSHASLVWSTTPRHAAYLKTLSPASLVAMINAAFRLSQTDVEYMFSLPASPVSGASTTSASQELNVHESELSWRLAHTPSHPSEPPVITSLQPGTLASFPLRFRQSTAYVSPRLALLGDAAHTIHPLAGQGLNLGLGDARALAACIGYSVAHGMDIGYVLALESYERERWGECLKVGGVVDGLEKMFGWRGSVAGWGRGVGMEFLGAEGGWTGIVGRRLRGWVMNQVD